MAKPKNSDPLKSQRSVSLSSAASVRSKSSERHNSSVPCEQCIGINQSELKTRFIIAAIICAAFMTAELIGGILANSLAIVSDAFHMLSDLGSYLINIISIWVSHKSKSHSMSFGFHRIEVLSALASILVLWFITGILVYEGISRIINPTYSLDPLLLLVFSVISIISNIFMWITLSGIPMLSKEKGFLFPKGASIGVKAAVIHVVGDLLQSVGVMVSGLVIYFEPKYQIVDPLCTFLFAIVTLYTTHSTMKTIIIVLMEGSPQGIDVDKVREALLSIPGVLKILSFHMWSLTLGREALASCILIDRNENPSKILNTAICKLNKYFGLFEVTLQIQLDEPSARCSVCNSHHHLPYTRL